MILDFSQNGICIQFEITEDKSIALKRFSNKPFDCSDKKLKWCPVLELHISGLNQDDHHGAKHTGTSGSVSLKYEDHKYYKNEQGNKLEISLRDDNVCAVVHYQFYSDVSAVRSWTTVTNISDKIIGLEYVSSFVYTGLPDNGPRVFIPHNAWKREVNWKEYTLGELGLDRNCAFSTKRITISNTGTWSSKEYLPMAAYSDDNETLMWQIENNGSWQWEISDISDMLYLKLSGPTEHENHWYRELAPNEEFESVKACVVLGNNFYDALAHMTEYRRQIIENNTPNMKMPIIFNDYMHCLWADPTTEKMIPVIDKVAEAGADYYCMDAGWYADGTWWETVGEWQPIERRFPDGIKKVFDYIKSKGMVPGIWLEPEVMGINCPIINEFEDECFFMRHGKKVIDHGRYQFDFRNKKVRDFTMSVIDRVVCEYGVGYIKFDYNIDGGIGTEVNADSFGDGLLEHNRAYLSWIKEIKEKYPNLILENCASGGMRMDYAALSNHHIQSVSDQEDYKYTAYIAAAAPTAVIPEQAAIWAYPLAESDENAVAFNMVSAMLQRIHLGGQITELSDDKFSLVKEGISVYKVIREDIAGAIPFYPLGIPKYGDGWLCLGMKGEQHKRIAVWRMDSETDFIEIPLNFEVNNAKVCYPVSLDCEIIKTDKGIKLCLPKNYTAVLLEI